MTTAEPSGLEIEQARLGTRPYLVLGWQRNYHIDGVWVQVAIVQSYDSKLDASVAAREFCRTYEPGVAWRGRPTAHSATPPDTMWVLQIGEQYDFRETIIWVIGPLQPPTLGPAVYASMHAVGSSRGLGYPNDEWDIYLDYAAERSAGIRGPFRDWV